MDDERQDQAQRIDDDMTLASIDLLSGIIARWPPTADVLTV
jgi:hypothetical protein